MLIFLQTPELFLECIIKECSSLLQFDTLIAQGKI